MMALPDIPGYSDVSPIGQGGLGEVYRARRDSTGGPVAFKLIRSDADVSTVRRRVEREVAALVQLKGHPFVVQIEEVIQTSFGPIVVMELAANGSLADQLKTSQRFTVPQYVLAAEHVAVALRDAHIRGIIHRDIKPHNLLIGDFGQVKVCDFGIAALVRETVMHDRTSALSYRYASPEELQDRDDVGPAADVYSLGVTVRHLATGSPVRSAKPGEPASWIIDLDPADAAVATSMWHLVERMVAPAPIDRPSTSEVLDTCERAGKGLGDRRVRRLEIAERPLEPTPASDTLKSSPTPGLGVGDGEADEIDITVVRHFSGVPPWMYQPLPQRASITGGRDLPQPNEAPTKWW